MSRFSSAVLALAIGGLCLAPAARAATPKISDQAGFFSKSAVQQAMQKIQDVYRRYKVEVVIETFPAIPQDMKDSYSPADKQAFFRRWAERRAADEGVKGIYMLICRDPAYLYMEPDESVRRKAFTLDDRTAVVGTVRALMKQEKYDAALAQTVNAIQSTLAVNEGAGAAPQGRRNPAAVNASPLFGWICFAVVAILVIWMIVALIRALSGGGSAGYGPGGYGAGGYGPGYGGGGGGFFSSLLGGMFGAAAGSWMYDSFFRGGQGSSWGGASQGYDSSSQDSLPADQPGAGVFGNDSGDGGGGDFGGDSSGGFDDGGGGDFGGGDFGGGGDGGGGGGDF